MASELDDLQEHLDRYRAVTLQHLEMLSDEDLSWRPRPDAFSIGQQLVHILQSEDFFIRGLADEDWDMNRLRFPKVLPSCATLKADFAAVRERTKQYLATLDAAQFDTMVCPPHAGEYGGTLRSWLWFVLEHEIHHKAQLCEYFRGLGRIPPYFAIPLPAGVRPDIAARAELGGV
jgi:uncharacterized damage-inducible protein DinB